MKKNLKMQKILSILLVALLILTTRIYAAEDRYDTTIQASPKQAKEGDKVEITLGISNLAIESGEKGIAGYTGKLTYDEDIFEYVSSKGTDQWDPPLCQKGYISSHTTSGEVVTTTQSIGSINLRVKEGAKLGETSITLENFMGATMGTTEVPAASQTTKVTIVSKDSGNGEGSGSPNNTTNTTNTVDQGNTNQVGNNTNTVGNQNGVGTGTSQNNTNNIANTKPGKLPQTGDNLSVVLVVIGIGTAVAISLYFRTKILTYKK